MTTKPVFKSNELASGKSQDTIRASIKSTQSSDRPLSSGKAGRSTPQPDSKPPSKPATLKREQSDIFKSFSKPTAKLKREDTGSSTGTSPAPSAAQAVRTHLFFPKNISSNLGRTRKPMTKMVRRFPISHLSFVLTIKEPMKDASEDEQEEDFTAANKDSSKQATSHSKREADLRKMMDEDGKVNPDLAVTFERGLTSEKTKAWRILPSIILKNRLL